MARTDLPPPPLGNDVGDYPWQEWFRLLLRRVAEEGQISVSQIEGMIPWDKISKSDSDLNDLETKEHSVLSELDYDSSGHTGFAREEGDNTVKFQVADAEEDDEAVSKAQLDDLAFQLIPPITESDNGNLVSYVDAEVSVAGESYEVIFDVSNACEILTGIIASSRAGYRLTIDGTEVINATTDAAANDGSGNQFSTISIPPAKANSSMKLEAYNISSSSRDFGWRVLTRQ